MIKKKKLIVYIGIAAFAVLLILYFAVIKPLTAPEAPPKREPLVLVDDIEQEGVNGRYLLFPQTKREKMRSVKVNNIYGGFEIFQDEDGEFKVRDHESAALDAQLLSYLVTSTGYTIAQMKICDYATEEQFAQYGLNEPQASWTVETVQGKKYSVEVGSRLVTGAGYYCRFVGRDSIYILSKDLEYTVLQPIEKLVSPVLVTGISNSDYYTADNFTLLHGDKVFLAARIKDKKEQKDPEALQEVEIFYPAKYEPSDDLYYGALNKLAALTGSSVAKLGFTDDELKRYNLDEPAYTVGFDYKGENILVLISKQQEDGTYFAMSNLFPETITVCDGDTLSFLQEDLLKWISPYVFQYNIASISEIEIKSPELDVVFSLAHGKDEKGNPALDVATNVGKFIENAENYNFRLLYKVLLSIAIKGDAPFGEDEVAAKVASEEPYMTFRYKNLTGKETVLDFYRYSTRRALVTIDGKGQFYVYVDLLDKIVGDVGRVLNGEEIDSYGKN